MAETAEEPRPRRLSYLAALSEGLSQAMRADPSVVVAGEDVAHYGGVFGSYRGLLDEFGPNRVIDTPIAEQALVGFAVGAAVEGLRPVVDIMFMDFIGEAMDQLANQAAKLRYMFGGTTDVPLTVVTMAGAGLSASAQHSQSLEAWLCHIPGLKVVMPSDAYTMKGLLAAAIQDDNPVVVVANKALLGAKADVPEEPYRIPMGKARVVRPGRDVTVVALGRMVSEAVAAASVLAEDGIEAEVIDPQTLQPFDLDSVAQSVMMTNHAVVAHEAVRFGGLGAEIAAQLQEEVFDYLDAPIGRIGAPFCPVPFSPPLEKLYLPDRDRIIAAVRGVLERRIGNDRGAPQSALL